MAHNYGNLSNSALDMLPIFGALPNGNSLANHPNFINQLAAAIKASNAAASSSSSSGVAAAAAAASRRERTPEPPPAPKFSPAIKMKPNQGTAPMDLDNDSENDTPTSTVNSSAVPAMKALEKFPFNMSDPNLYLNSLMSAGMNAAAAASTYMFFPTTTTAAAAGAAGTANSMLLDPNAMMAAAMQQLQHGYAGYAMPTEGIAVDAASASGGGGVGGANAVAQAAMPTSTGISETYSGAPMKEVIKTKSCILFPPNPNAPPPTIRERPPGCRTIFVGGLPENISEDIIREIFESCGEITTLRMSKKNFCHIRYRHEASIDRAINLSGYRARISSDTEIANFGRLHVDYAQARDDQYDYECKQRQLQREQRHRDRMSQRTLSPPPMPHYTDHEASLLGESLRNNDTFVKAVQTISAWLERGDCTKRNANIFYSMIQSTHAHVRRLHSEKHQLEEDLRKAREIHRKQMLAMSTQFTQIEKVFSAASHKKVWDHFSKAQRKNIDQWKKLAMELRSVQIEDDEMEMSDDDRDYHSSSAKRTRYDSDNLKEENDSLRCQLEAIRNEMSLERSDIKCNSDFREKQIKVLQETIRNMQTQLLHTKIREQKDAKTIEALDRKLKEAGVKQLLLKTKIKETTAKLKDKGTSSLNSEEGSELLMDEQNNQNMDYANAENRNLDDSVIIEEVPFAAEDKQMGDAIEKMSAKDDLQVIDIDVYKCDDDVKIIEEQTEIVEIHENEDEKLKCNKQENEVKAKVTTTISVQQEEKNKIAKQADNETEELKKDLELKRLRQAEAKIIALSAAYLVVHPCGVSSERICQYLNDMFATSREDSMPLDYLEAILKNYTNLFKAETQIDDNNKSAATTDQSNKWIFCGYATTKNANNIK